MLLAAIDVQDGLVFTSDGARAEVIRGEEQYAGVRVSLTCSLARADVTFHVDVNVGDPITPAPQRVAIPKLLGGELHVLGYPLAMAHTEKIVTAIARGAANTRWRDFGDLYVLSRLRRARPDPVPGLAAQEPPRGAAGGPQRSRPDAVKRAADLWFYWSGRRESNPRSQFGSPIFGGPLRSSRVHRRRSGA